MRLNPKLDITESYQARIAAQEIITAGFDPKRAIAALRPDVKGYNALYTKLMSEPAVQEEIFKIMNRTERNASKFMSLMWDWLENEGTEQEIGPNHTKVKLMTKDESERKVAAARILAKGYISEKPEKDKPATPFVIEGVTQEGLANLTGDRKVM